MLFPILIAASTFITPPAKALPKPGVTVRNERLAAILKDWQAAEDRVKDVHKVMRRTFDDKTWRTKETALIELTAKKPGLMRIEVKDSTKKMQDLIVLTEKECHLFNFQARRDWAVQFRATSPSNSANDKPGSTNYGFDFLQQSAADNQFVASFMLELVRHAGWHCFDVERFIQEYEPKLDGEDAHYCYLSFRLRKRPAPDPKFTLLSFCPPPELFQIALLKMDSLPRQIILQDLNGNVTTLETLKLETNLTPPVTIQSIEADMPKGWTKK